MVPQRHNKYHKGHLNEQNKNDLTYNLKQNAMLSCLVLLAIHPKSNVALLMYKPSTSVLRQSCPNFVHICSYVVPPSAFLSSPPPLSCPWFPISESFCPSVIVSPGYKPRPSPFSLFYFLYYVFAFGFISYYRCNVILL